VQNASSSPSMLPARARRQCFWCVQVLADALVTADAVETDIKAALQAPSSRRRGGGEDRGFVHDTATALGSAALLVALRGEIEALDFMKTLVRDIRLPVDARPALRLFATTVLGASDALWGAGSAGVDGGGIGMNAASDLFALRAAATLGWFGPRLGHTSPASLVGTCRTLHRHVHALCEAAFRHIPRLDPDALVHERIVERCAK
jgi:hypothetical protein